MKIMIDISVITLNYKEALLTKKCIESILPSKGISFEIIIIDNSCSKKEAETLLSIRSKKIKVFVMKKNIGCARGYNTGIQKSHGKHIMILNNDAEIHDNKALFKMMSFINDNPGIGALQPKIKSLHKPTYFDYAGAAGGFIDLLGYPFCRGRIFSQIEKDEGQYDDIIPITWASTCAFFARRKTIIKAGLFDPIYFAYAEEVDMSLKLWKMGYKVVYFPKVEVFHKGAAAWKKLQEKKTFLIHRNHLILYLKCFPLSQYFFSFFYRIILEYMSIIYYIMVHSSLQIFSVLLSHLAVLINLPIIFYKRHIFYKNTNSRVLFYRRSIVFDYFVRKKKHFLLLKKSDFIYI